MKKFIQKYPALFRLAFVLLVSAVLWSIGLVSTALALVFTFQLAELATSKRVGFCFIAALTPKQLEEFQDIMTEMGEQWGDVKAMLKDFGEVKGDLKKMRRTMAMGGGGGVGNCGVRWLGNVPFVTDDCAEFLTASFINGVNELKGEALASLCPDSGTRERLLNKSKSIIGLQIKAALTGTEIPLPTIYAPQIIELVFMYGQSRQYATVFPLGAGTVKLPRLKAGEDDFGYFGAGTAGMSQPITEKKVTAELVTFTANKFGGLIRIPYELEEDTFIPIGQFLARFIARQLAKGEDKTMFLADGTATYASQTGVGPYCVANPTYLRQLGAGKTKVTDATLNDFRAMRGLVSAAVLGNMAANGQTAAAYYMNPTLEGLLVTFNTIGAPQVYVPQQGGKPASLDGFPIHWIGVSGANSGAAAPSTFVAFFGDLSYWYLGERGSVRVEVSKEVFFATDELAMRALERIDVEALAIDAMSALETAAA